MNIVYYATIEICRKNGVPKNQLSLMSFLLKAKISDRAEAWIISCSDNGSRHFKLVLICNRSY